MRTNFYALLGRQTENGFSGTELCSALGRLPSVTPVGPWLCGGALRRTLLDGKLSESDFDFFFANDKQAKDFYDEMIDIGAYVAFRNEKQVTYIVTANMTEDEEGKKITLPKLKVQAINISRYPTAEAVLDSFDFTLCQFAFDGEDLICGEYALWDLGRNLLVPHKVSFGTATLRRLIKYTKQGFRICGGGLSDILEQVVAAPDIIHAETHYID